MLLTRDGLKLPYITSVLKRNNLLVYERVQLEQISRDELVVRVVPSRQFDETRDRKRIEEAYFNEFGGEFKINVEIVGKIETSGAGKFQNVISKLAMDSLRATLDKSHDD